MSLYHHKASMVLLALLVSGCMQPQIANTKYMDELSYKEAANTKQSPQQICEAGSVAIAMGNKEKLHFYAPLHLAQAVNSLEEGQELIKNKETITQGLSQCFKVKKLIDNGVLIKAKVQVSLNDVLDELKQLKKVDSSKKFTDDIQDYIEDTIDLVKIIEAGKMNDAMQGQAELIKDMLELEIKIITEKNIAAVEAMIERAEDVDADDLASKTFEQAERELIRAKKFIRENYRDNAQVIAASNMAMLAAKHAYSVAKEVESLQQLKPDAAEDKVLYIESLLQAINKKLNKAVVIGASLDEQSDIIAQRVDSLVLENKSLKREYKQLTESQSLVK